VGALAPLLSDDARPVFCDPMCGSVSVPLTMPLADRGAVVLGDAGPRLIPTYRAIRRDPEGVHRALAAYPSDVAEACTRAVKAGLTSGKRDARAGRYTEPWKAYYYAKRAELNALRPLPGEVATPERAALFLWVQRAGFNGLFRTGPEGASSVPAGDRFTTLSLSTLASFSHHLRGAVLCDGSFTRTIQTALSIGAVDLFLDPPYAGDYDGYTAAGFTDDHRADLAACVRDVVQAGGRALVTEADHPDAHAWLEAAGLYVRTVTGRTSISRSAEQRGAKAELVARSWPW
jgi:site-specific DNA-adenine methylase